MEEKLDKLNNIIYKLCRSISIISKYMLDIEYDKDYDKDLYYITVYSINYILGLKSQIERYNKFDIVTPITKDIINIITYNFSSLLEQNFSLFKLNYDTMEYIWKVSCILYRDDIKDDINSTTILYYLVLWLNSHCKKGTIDKISEKQVNLAKDLLDLFEKEDIEIDMEFLNSRGIKFDI